MVRSEKLHKARKAENAELASLLHCNKRLILMQNKPYNNIIMTIEITLINRLP
jgi:hypothetical protein